VARRSGKKGGDEALVQALAGGASVPVAARAAAVSERTVYRRLEDAAFCEAVARLRSRMTGQAIGRLSATGTLAVKVLRTLALTAKSETVRQASARSILEFSFRGEELATLQERLAAIERRLMAPAPGNSWAEASSLEPPGNGEQSCD
jgi:hypothetical protein